jgi:hypothetical protein
LEPVADPKHIVVHRGSFTRAVRSQQAKDLARLHPQGKIIHRCKISKAFDQVHYFNRGCCGLIGSHIFS